MLSDAGLWILVVLSKGSHSRPENRRRYRALVGTGPWIGRRQWDAWISIRNAGLDVDGGIPHGPIVFVGGFEKELGDIATGAGKNSATKNTSPAQRFTQENSGFPRNDGKKT